MCFGPKVAAPPPAQLPVRPTPPPKPISDETLQARRTQMLKERRRFSGGFITGNSGQKLGSGDSAGSTSSSLLGQ